MFSAGLSAAQTEQQPSSTEIELLKAENGMDLCFLPVETVVGAQVHVIVERNPRSSTVPKFNGLKATTITISNTGSPIVLLIYTRNSKGDLVWRFNVVPDANLVGVHLMSDRLPTLEGLPANIPVTVRYSVDQDDDTKNDCEYLPVTEPSLAEYGPQNLSYPERGFGGFGHILGMRSLDQILFEFAGMNIVSFQHSAGGWEDGVARSIRSFCPRIYRDKSEGLAVA